MNGFFYVGRVIAPATIVLACTLCLLTATPNSANAASKSAPSTLERVLLQKVLRVCIWPDYYGISYRNPKTQQLAGIDIDLAHEFGNDLGKDVAVQFIDSSFATLAEDLAGDRCDIGMFAVGITPARAEKMRFSKPYLHSDIYAITTKANRRIKQWSDIDKRGVVVAVHKGTYHENVMREKLTKATLLVADTPFAREQEVESGRADVFMTDFPYSQRMLVNAEWARLITPPTAYHLTSYAYAVKPGDDIWLEAVERFVADIKRDGRLLTAARRHRLDPIVSRD